MFVRASKYRRLRECAVRVEGRCDAMLVELGNARVEASRQAGRNAALQAEVDTLKAELSAARTPMRGVACSCEPLDFGPVARTRSAAVEASPIDRYVLEPDGRTIHVDVPAGTSVTIGRYCPGPEKFVPPTITE